MVEMSATDLSIADVLPTIPAPRGRQDRKTIYTLVTDNYAPRIRELTFPLLQNYANKIGADFHVITERKRPEWPVTIEKFQVAELAVDRGDEWTMFIDADALVSPEFFDPTDHMNKNTVGHNGKDMAGVRWTADKYMRRDGRWYGSCTWFVIASDWTVEDLWQLPTQTPQEAFSHIHITIGEHNSGHCQTEHLIDDYTLSRNIARFGLKTTTIVDICGQLGWKDQNGRGFNPHLFHLYSISEEEKLSRMLAVLATPNGQVIPDPRPGFPPVGVGWGVMDPEFATAKRKEWGVR
jgi:hypothetical protein